MLLALGHASITWSKEEFNGLLLHILASEKKGDLKTTFPVFSLVLVSALPELAENSIQETTLDLIMNTLVTFYHIQLQSKYRNNAKVLENSLMRLRKNPLYKDHLVSTLETWLSSDCSDKHCTVASLAVALRLMNSNLEI